MTVPRLGSVVGGILAELANASMIADRRTRDLVAEYEEDPILSTVAVPRVTIGQVSLRLRFTIDDFLEPEGSSVDADAALVQLRDQFKDFIPSLVQRFSLERAHQDKLAELTAPDITRASLERALEGDIEAAVKGASERVLSRWNELDSETQKALGGKTRFHRTVSDALRNEITMFTVRQKRKLLVDDALRSEVNIGILSSQLPEKDLHIQEIDLVIEPKDFDLIVSGEGI